MANTYRTCEQRIEQAMEALNHGDFTKITDAARRFDVPYQRLRARLNGRKSRSQRLPTNLKLTPEEDAGLCQYLDRLDDLGLPPRPLHIAAAAKLILAYKPMGDKTTNSHIRSDLGEHWVRRWLIRHPQYKRRRQKPLDLNRQLAHEPEKIQRWFNNLEKLIADEGIVKEDFYNYDESGFMIGYGRDQFILTKHAYRRQFLPSSQNRESVTCGETISGDGSVLPAMVILSGQLHLNGWVNNELDGNTLMAVSDTGYCNDEIALAWLKHFDRFSAARQVGRKRLLLLDNHVSHATAEFLYYARERGIIPYYLPPHTTHFLQPLDVVVFQPYKHWHSEAVDAATRTGCTNINKVEFLAALQSIRLQTFKMNTIKSAWRKTGIIPWNPGPIVQYVKELAFGIRTPSPVLSLVPAPAARTPSSHFELQAAIKDLVDDHTIDMNNERIRKVVKASIGLATAGTLALDNLAQTRVAEKARESRKQGARRVTQRGGLIYAEDARMMTRNREAKEEAQASRWAAKTATATATARTTQQRGIEPTIQPVQGGAFITLDFTQTQ